MSRDLLAIVDFGFGKVGDRFQGEKLKKNEEPIPIGSAMRREKHGITTIRRYDDTMIRRYDDRSHFLVKS